MCEAEDFLQLVYEEVEEQLEGYSFSKEEIIELVMAQPEKWKKVYSDWKHLLYSDKKATKKRLREKVKEEVKLEQLLKDLKHQDSHEYPHYFVINKWLKKNLQIEWKEIPLKYQTKDSMRPELIAFIEKTKNMKVKTKDQFEAIDQILTIFQVKCAEMAKKEAEIQMKAKDRLMTTRIKKQKRDEVLLSVQFYSLKLAGIEQDRKDLINDVKPLLNL